jgi:hypothetical protein
MKSIKNLNMVWTIDPQFTADQWKLYTASMDCNEAAKELNAALLAQVKSGLNREQANVSMHNVMRKFAAYGAVDSEARWFLQDVLDEIYNRI